MTLFKDFCKNTTITPIKNVSKKDKQMVPQSNVFVVTRGLTDFRESFEDDESAFEYAKKMSDRNLASFVQNKKGKMFCFENGEQATAGRMREITKIIDDHMTAQLDREQREFRGKRSVKKQK